MRPQDQHSDHLANCYDRHKDGEPGQRKMRRFDRSQHNQRGVAGEKEVVAGIAIARGRRLDRLTDGDDRVGGWMRTRRIGQILLVALHGFQQPLRRRIIGKVIPRVAMELLGDIKVRDLPLAARALLLAEFTVDHVRQDGGAQAFHPAHRVGFTTAADPLLLERSQQVIEQTRQPLDGASGLGLWEPKKSPVV